MSEGTHINFNMSCNCFMQLCKSVSASLYLVCCSADFCWSPFSYPWTMTTIEIIFLAWAAWHKSTHLNLWCTVFEKCTWSLHCTCWAPWGIAILFSFLSYWEKIHVPIYTYLSLISIFTVIVMQWHGKRYFHWSQCVNAQVRYQAS